MNPTSGDRSAQSPPAVASTERSEPADLFRAEEKLRGRFPDLLKENRGLISQLRSTNNRLQHDRNSRLAALNLMEDAIDARRQSQAINDDLLQKITALERAEEALHVKDRQLQQVLEGYRQLNGELDRRVQERTRELAEREERLRELTAQVTRAEQEERQRLARLLHDHVQQLLVAARLRIDLVSTNAPEPIQHKLTNVLAILNDAIDATRDLSVQLAPPLLHDQGLPAALEWLAGRMSALHSVRIQADIDPAADPDCPEVRDILFHAAQELLLNVVKHSGVAQAKLRLRRKDDHCLLTVQDRGVGFERDQSSARNSFGLLQIRQRLEANGGQLVIDSTPEKGSLVSARLPLQVSRA